MAVWPCIPPLDDMPYAFIAKPILSASYAASFWIEENKNEKRCLF